MASDPQIRVILLELENVTDDVIKKITLDFTANLIESTPVDTGWARANWVPAIGQPYAPVADNLNPTDSDVSATSGIQQQGLSVVATGYTLDQGRVFVSNNVPYITRLNDGHSQQTPSGFIQRAITKAVTIDTRGLLR